MIPGDLVEDVGAVVGGRRLIIVGEPLVVAGRGGPAIVSSVSPHHSLLRRFLIKSLVFTFYMSSPHHVKVSLSLFVAFTLMHCTHLR